MRYKYTITWLILFSVSIAIAAVSMGGDEEPDIYNPGIIVGAILVFFCCPAFIYDYKHTEKYKLKQDEKNLQLQMQRKRIETAIKQQDLDIERQKMALEQEKAELEEKLQDSIKYCHYCGKQIEQKAAICPFCGSNLKEGLKTVPLETPQTPLQTQPTTKIIIQEAPKISIWKQLITWIVSEICYCIFFTVMMTLMIVMTILLI